MTEDGSIFEKDDEGQSEMRKRKRTWVTDWQPERKFLKGRPSYITLVKLTYLLHLVGKEKCKFRFS